jgi:hypothetical protein
MESWEAVADMKGADRNPPIDADWFAVDASPRSLDGRWRA